MARITAIPLSRLSKEAQQAFAQLAPPDVRYQRPARW
jgi:hypothetical protein